MDGFPPPPNLVSLVTRWKEEVEWRRRWWPNDGWCLFWFFPLSSCHSFLVEGQEITHPSSTPTSTCCSLVQCQLILFPAWGDALAVLCSLPFPPFGNIQDLITLHHSRKFILSCRLFTSLCSSAKKKWLKIPKWVWHEKLFLESLLMTVWDWPHRTCFWNVLLLLAHFPKLL